MKTSIAYLIDLEGRLRAHQNVEDAQYMLAYMKGHFQYFGIRADLRRKIQRAFLTASGWPGDSDWREFCTLAWQKEEREFQMIAMELFFRMKKAWKKEDLSLIESLIVNKSWWDSVDYIASNIVGTYFIKFPDALDQIISKWKKSDNIWLVRTCILFQLKYKDDTNFELLKELAEMHKESKEFFIQKAIGWSLRQYAKFEPQLVVDYVEGAHLKPLSHREALKHFQ